MSNSCVSSGHDLTPASSWVQRWSHLVPARGAVLDVACGHGRHMQWFAQRGHRVTGLDRSPDAIASAVTFGDAILSDLERDPWPLMSPQGPRQFEAVIVANYLWRPLLPMIAYSVAPGGLLIYETFTQGNEVFGRPSRPDFLLQPGELLGAFAALQLVAFEEGFVDDPARCVQRIAAIQPSLPGQAGYRRPPYPL